MEMRTKPIAFAILSLLTAVLPAAAKKSPLRPFYMPNTVTMDGAEIPQGMYQITVETQQSGVTVELWRDGRFIATARGAWVKSGMKFKDNTILLRVNPDGSRSLIELRLAGSAKSIVLKTPVDDKIQAVAK